MLLHRTKETIRLLLLSLLIITDDYSIAAPIKPSTEPKAGEEREFEIAPKLKMKFCWIPPGEVQLGIPADEVKSLKNLISKDTIKSVKENCAEHVHGRFKTTGFWMGKYEVTQSQYTKVIGFNPSGFQEVGVDRSLHPVEKVNWLDCHAFIKKCNVLYAKVRLPSDEGWEYAYRGGKGNRQPYYWGHSLNGLVANCNGEMPFGTDKKGPNLQSTTPVGHYESKAKHPWGLCDMSGNVSEWCNPVKPHKEGYIPLLGGSWFVSALGCRGGGRGYENRCAGNSDYGFRIVLVQE